MGSKDSVFMEADIICKTEVGQGFGKITWTASAFQGEAIVSDSGLMKA